MLAIQGFVARETDNSGMFLITQIGTQHTFQTDRELKRALEDAANEMRECIKPTAVESRKELRIFFEFKDV